MFKKFKSKKSVKRMSRELKNLCNECERKTPETKRTAYKPEPIEPFNYKPMVISALQNRASLEYFRTNKI